MAITGALVADISTGGIENTCGHKASCQHLKRGEVGRGGKGLQLSLRKHQHIPILLLVV